MRKTVVIFIFSLLCLQVKAQFEDSIRNAVSFPPRFFVQLNSRNGFITNKNIKTIGLVAGIRFHKQLSFGIAYNQLLTKVVTNNYATPEVNYLLRLKLHYFSLSPTLEYTYFAAKRWQISIPVQFSFGGAFYTDQYDVKRYGGMVIAYEPGIAAEYYIFRFFSLGLGVGYRLALYKNSAIIDHFTAPTYQLKTGIYFGKLFNLSRKIGKR